MLVILDRDGVINAYEAGDYIYTLADWKPLPGSIEAIARLCQAGYQVAVATNQSAISRGYCDREAVDRLHQHLQNLVEAAGGHISYFAVCPHHPDEACQCRKPETALLREIQRQLGLADLHQSWMVGDSRKDLEAALGVGARPVLVTTTGNGPTTLAGLAREPLPNVEQAADLAGFVERLLSSSTDRDT